MRPTLRQSPLRALFGDERGVSAIEFGMIAPVVILILLGASTYFVIGRDDYRSKRATYTASDIVARQKTVSDGFLATVKSMAERIAISDARTLGFRVSSASKVDKALVLDWSYATTPFTKLGAIETLVGKMPDVSSGESVIVVETSTPYKPMFGMFGTTTLNHLNVSFSRPRVVKRISKSD